MSNKKEIIINLASEFHENWRSSLKKKDGTYLKDLEITNDKDFIKNNKEKIKRIKDFNFVDIAALSFDKLPSDWQKENLQAAKVVIDLIYDLKNLEVSKEKIEEMAQIVHNEWVKRNKEDQNIHLLIEYKKLSNKEKQKDIFQVFKGIEILKKDRTRSR